MVIQREREWSSVLLVLMKHTYETYEIWEAERETLEPELDALGRKGMPVKRFKALGTRRWPSPGGQNRAG